VATIWWPPASFQNADLMFARPGKSAHKSRFVT
jgi:hypothetical protein